MAEKLKAKISHGSGKFTFREGSRTQQILPSLLYQCDNENPKSRLYLRVPSIDGHL